MLQGRIYFVEAQNGLVKIGFTRDLKGRVTTLQAISPVPLELIGSVEGRSQDEGTLHSYFANYRHHGEWFRPHPDMFEFAKRQTVANLTVVEAETEEPPEPGNDEQRQRIKTYLEAGGTVEQIALSLDWPTKWVRGEVARMRKLGLLDPRPAAKAFTFPAR